jgi:hypothetical protein
MEKLILEALRLAQDKDQRVGQNQDWFITLEQLDTLVKEVESN